MAVIVAPSVLAANFSDFAGAVREIDGSQAPWVHLDVMDGRFVPNLTFGPKLVEDLRPLSGAFFDVHLMTAEPDSLIPAFAKAGADQISFHIEAVVHAHRTLERIRELGKAAGISIVPSTPVSAIGELLPFLDYVLVMTVNPGFGGQTLIPQCLDKVRLLAKLREAGGYNYRIAVDGGVNPETAACIRDAGTDVLVTGSAFFRALDKKALVRGLAGISNSEFKKNDSST
ncbi:MAG: ribulose-phosphate 3-epimerase [Treponema sp.]|jgi:ribulose-phosphate 3-epimerase|nr:ribulose-phosphate 3-epimerase [Treponema sp.]